MLTVFIYLFFHKSNSVCSSSLSTRVTDILVKGSKADERSLLPRPQCQYPFRRGDAIPGSGQEPTLVSLFFRAEVVLSREIEHTNLLIGERQTANGTSRWPQVPSQPFIISVGLVAQFGFGRHFEPAIEIGIAGDRGALEIAFFIPLAQTFVQVLLSLAQGAADGAIVILPPTGHGIPTEVDPDQPAPIPTSDNLSAFSRQSLGLSPTEIE